MFTVFTMLSVKLNYWPWKTVIWPKKKILTQAPLINFLLEILPAFNSTQQMAFAQLLSLLHELSKLCPLKKALEKR